jgi:hypothetical protein
MVSTCRTTFLVDSAARFMEGQGDGHHQIQQAQEFILSATQKELFYPHV